MFGGFYQISVMILYLRFFFFALFIHYDKIFNEKQNLYLKIKQSINGD